MKLARLKQPEEENIKADLERLKNVFASYQILIPETDLLTAWGLYSESKESDWLPLLEKDEDIYLALVDYLEIFEW